MNGASLGARRLSGEPRLCAGTRHGDGEPCDAFARSGSAYCYQHDPELEEERQAVLAGRERQTGAPILAEGMPLNTTADVEALLRQTALYLATGNRIEARRATALTALATQLLRAIKIRELEEELEAAHAEIDRLRAQCAASERNHASENGHRPPAGIER